MNTETRLTDISLGNTKDKYLTDFKDARYSLDFGGRFHETIFIETENDDLLLITSQGTLRLKLSELRKPYKENNIEWFDLFKSEVSK